MNQITHSKERNSSKILSHTSNEYMCNACPFFSFFGHITEERTLLPCTNLTTLHREKTRVESETL